MRLPPCVMGDNPGEGALRMARAEKTAMIAARAFFARLVIVLPVLLLGACGAGPERGVSATRITIESAPEQGAEVLVDGIDRGLTPVTIEGVRTGWVDVLVRKENYRRATDRILVKAGAEETFVLEMEPLTGHLSLDSEPAGAEILINDNALGKTPMLRMPLPIGEHVYELRMPNYYPVRESLTVQEDFQYEFKHRLRPIEATLSVLSQPTGAQIWLNNQLQDRKTPARFRLAPDLYVVSVHSKGFVQEEERVTLSPNADQSVTLRMRQGTVPPGMVLIPAGNFLWGEDDRSPDESPRREMLLDAYYIDKHEVTNEQFKKVFPGHDFPKGQEQFPASGISWSQASQYAQAVGKRLPTEAEWEKAARGDDGREYPWGAEFSKSLCNTAELDMGAPTTVGRFLGGASPYGCMDMAGNVYEWVSNWYEAYPGNTQITKDYGQIYRVLRGGSFTTGRFHARCARRHFDRMDAQRADYGLRCVKDVDSSLK